MSYDLIAILMFSTMMLMLLTGQRVFGAIGFVAAAASLLLWGDGGFEMPFNASFVLFNWYPMLTLPLFIYMGYVLSESGIASDLYRMFHVWMGPMPGGLAVGTIGLMVAVSAMNGLSVAGMAIGASIALPELLRRGYDKIMVTGVVQAGSTLGILVPPSVVLVLYGMIARQPVGKLWLAGVFPGLLLASLFIAYIIIRCRLQPELGPALSKQERQMPFAEKLGLLRAGLLPLFIFFCMTGLFLLGVTSLVESSAVGAAAATLAALFKRRLTRKVVEDTVRKTLGISCMFLWIILAALCFGAVFDGLGAVKAIESLFVTQWEMGPWEILIMMQLSYIGHGHVSGRHRHAGDRRPALRAAGHGAWLRSGLVRRALHHHGPDRLHDPAVWLQPLPDARDGAAGSHSGRYLSLDFTLRPGDDPRPGPGDRLPPNRALAARGLLRSLGRGRALGRHTTIKWRTSSD